MRRIKTTPLIPDRFEIEEINEREILLKVSPFEIGYAISVAHPLKRLLMSSSVGFAPVAIRVENASHEFDNISGMLEDISELLINLKSIRFKLKNGLEKTEVSYSFKGPKEIYGSDLETDDVEIVSPENFLATLNDDGELNFDLIIYKGTGYVPSEDIRETVLEERENFIPLDAYFTPVKKANYRIDNVLVDENPNYEMIVFDIESDGQIPPRVLVGETLKVLEGQLSILQHVFGDKNLIEPAPKKGKKLPKKDTKAEKKKTPTKLSKSEEAIVEKLTLEIKDLGLQPRFANTLNASGHRFVGDVAFLEDKELEEIKNFGATSIKALKDALNKAELDREVIHGLSRDAREQYRKKADKLLLDEKGIE
ncbi:DNA-directed RNA polymerase, alpha subunit [Thiovulum sp. ES]|nr:DNA-directed RNA polymerase, alpha subunit [Thiovulum sp. ES]